MSDRESQRWIPLPQGGRTEALDQVQLLRRVRDLVAADAEIAPLPKLSEEQLLRLEQLFKSWQERAEGSQLPNLADIPHEWLNAALIDPVMRRQAQSLLEQYARSRNLPRTRRGEAVGSADRVRNHVRPNSGRPPVAAAGAAQLPRRPPREQTQALRNLLTELMAEMPVNQGESGQHRSAASQPRRPRLPSGHRVTEHSQPQHTTPRPIPTPRSAAPNRIPSRQPPSGRESRGGPRAPGRPKDARRGAFKQQQHSSPRRTVEVPTRRGQNKSRPSPSKSKHVNLPPPRSASPRATGSTIRGKPTAKLSPTLGQRPTRQEPAMRHRPPPPPDPANSVSTPDTNKRVQLAGLGRKLRQIVERTVQEQRSRPQTASPPQRPSLLDSNRRQPSRNRAASAGKQDGEPPATTGVRPKATESTRRSSAARRVAAATSKSIRRLVSHIWTAIASAPTETSLPKAASSIGSAAAPRQLTVTGNRWGSRVWGVLALIALVAFYFALPSKSVKRSAASDPVARARTQEILQTGIRSRADVVFAFHHFVLHQQRTVATWWTHRYVARRLAKSAPHLRAVIQELTNVYEQARYLPPEAELSREQLQRVQSALQQCQGFSV